MKGNTTVDSRILGTLRTARGKGIVRMENRFETPIQNLWLSLTDPDRLARWLGDVKGDLCLGGEFHAHFVASGWQGTGRVEICDPPRHLLVLSREATEVSAALDYVSEVTLTPEGDKVLFVWEERGMPANLIAEYGAGNQLHVEDLADHIAGREPRRDWKLRWQQLIPAYRNLSKLDSSVERVVESYKAAVFAKDVDAFTQLYDVDVRVFDMWQMWSYEGAAAWRGAVNAWLTSLGNERVRVTFDDVETISSGNLTAVTAIVTYASISAQGDELRSMQNRVSWVLGTSSGVLKIVHEHTSAPAGFQDMKVILVR